MSDKDFVKELEGKLMESISNKMDEYKQGAEEMKQTLAENKKEIELLKSKPATQMSLGSTGKVDAEYKGYNLNSLGGGKEVVGIWNIKNQEVKNGVAKMLIDAMDACASGRQTFDIIKNTTMSEGTAGSGGYLVFDEFMSMIKTMGEKSSFVLAECDVVPMNSDTLHYPIDNDQTITVAQKNETVAYADGVPSSIVAEVELSAKNLGAYGIITNDLRDDSTFDVVSFLLPKFAGAVGRKLDSYALTSGSNSIGHGIINATGVIDSTGILDFTHILDAFGKLDERSEDGAALYIHKTPMYGIMTPALKSTNEPVYQAYINSGLKAILGTRIVNASTLPSTLTEGSYCALLANLKQALVIGQRKGFGNFFFNPYSLDLERETRITLDTRWAMEPAFGQACVQLIY